MLDEPRALIAQRYPHAFYLALYAATLAEHDQVDDAKAVLASICRVHGSHLCNAAREQWSQYAKLRPKVAAVAWPAL